jgi:hypothetical protein
MGLTEGAAPDEKRPSSHRTSAVAASLARFAPPAEGALTVPRFLGLTKTLAVRVTAVCEAFADCFVPEEVAKGTAVGLKIGLKALKDTLELKGTVGRVTPPPPVAKDWAVRIELGALTREQQLKIAGWRNYLTATNVREREQARQEERRKDLGMI